MKTNIDSSTLWHGCLYPKARLFQTTLITLGLAVLSFAQVPGALDPTFGTGGKVITPGLGGISDIALQPDGKIVAVGGDKIVRYNTNGSLDTSIGTGGIVVIQLGDNISGIANSVVVQADGKIVAAGRGYSVATGEGFAVVRYNPNGTLDTSFNGTGKIFNPNQGGSASAVAMQPDGKIVVVCNLQGYSASVFRYHSNGAHDTSFNGTGSVVIPNSLVSSVAIQTDGKIVVGGSLPWYSYRGAIIFRYNSDGSPDTAFGDAGRVGLFEFPDWYDELQIYSHQVNHVAILSDGKIVARVSGDAIHPIGIDLGFAHFARYNSNGSNDGVFEDPFTPHTGYAGNLAIQPDGKIVTVGNLLADFAVARHYQNGSPDTTFAEQGFVTTGFGNHDEATAVAIQVDGKIVVGGVSRILQLGGNPISHFALARYRGGPRNRFDFDGDAKADVSVYRPSEGNWYVYGSQAGFMWASWGNSTDKIAAADFDGDGKTDYSVFRDGTWLTYQSSGAVTEVPWGAAGDIPVPADYDGDGRADQAVFRGGTWWIYRSTEGPIGVQWGVGTDIPVPADYDGDGKADVAIVRDGTWWIYQSTAGPAGIAWGQAGDKPVPADYDGDGRADVAIVRDGTWWIYQSTLGPTGIAWGNGTDIPVPADYDGDGRSDVAVFREGTWWIYQSTLGATGIQWGLATDIPVNAPSGTD